MTPRASSCVSPRRTRPNSDFFVKSEAKVAAETADASVAWSSGPLA